MTEFPIEAVRTQFPALALKDNNQPRIYLDNPAGTQVSQRVIDGVAKGMTIGASNLGGAFSASRTADQIWHDAHQSMADFLGASPKEVIIGPSMTNLTFNMSRTIGRTLSAGDEIIVTCMDHEGDISPWLHLARDLDLVIKWLPFDKETWRIEPQDLESLLSDKTRLLALNYASNLTGSINDVNLLVSIARDAGILTYVDAVQFAPHGLIDVNTIGCDFLACSSYKFFGPHMGILWGRQDILESLDAYKCRCSSMALPEKFETGTPQTEMLCGLIETVGYLEWLGSELGGNGTRRDLLRAAYDGFGNYENNLTRAIIEGLMNISGITIHGITNNNRISERVPTISFTHDKVDPETIASSMANAGIFVWHGHNYAFEPVRHLGINENTGVVRVGIAHYNTQSEIDKTLEQFTHILN
jgi:cysteine desulfurase family protein (TIGR01976 family)